LIPILPRTHCDLFPNTRIVQADVVDRLKSIIMHAYAGVMFLTLTHYLMIEDDFLETVTSETSLAPYNAEDLNVLMTLIGPLKGKAFGDSRLCELTVDYRKCRRSARAFYMYHWCVASLRLVAFFS
jgi:hypothetical protein